MISVLYEDKYIVVINKPANMPAQKDFSRTPDMLSAVNAHTKTECFLIHRLDRHVAGLVVLAKTKEAAAILNLQLTQKKLDADIACYRDGFYKEYLAVVVDKKKQFIQIYQDESHTFAETNGNGQSDTNYGQLIKHYQKKEQSVAKTITHEEYGMLKERFKAEYKEAILKYDILDYKVMGEDAVALLKIDLITGRFHQIRSQLAKIDLPILGDPKYGIVSLTSQSFSKIGLQATVLKFNHPKTNKKMEFNTKHDIEPFNLFFSMNS